MEKVRIVCLVVEYILDYVLLFINIGIINEVIVKELFNYIGLKIIINNLYVVVIVNGKVDFEVIIVGGKVCSWDGGIIGEVILDFVF